MLTPEQEKWLDHLSNTDKIRILPFDATAEKKFEKVKRKIQAVIGDEYAIEHHGATSLGISGQDEIDIYIPVSPEKFDLLIEMLQQPFGKSRSFYPQKRAHFVTNEDGKHIDIFPINQESDDWKNMIRFKKILKENSKQLEEYRKLKESGNGLSIREYYRQKLIFINNILSSI